MEEGGGAVVPPGGMDTDSSDTGTGTGKEVGAIPGKEGGADKAAADHAKAVAVHAVAMAKHAETLARLRGGGDAMLTTAIKNRITALQGECLTLEEGWWSYEVCVGVNATQFRRVVSHPETRALNPTLHTLIPKLRTLKPKLEP